MGEERFNDKGFLIRSAICNARRMAKAEFKRKPNWVMAMELFLCGSTMAHEMCKAAEVDPDGRQFDMWTGYPSAPKEDELFCSDPLGCRCKGLASKMARCPRASKHP